MDEQRYRHNRSHRGRRDPRGTVLAAALTVVLLVATGVAATFVLRTVGDRDERHAPQPRTAAAASCANRIDVATAASFAPVLRELQEPLRAARDCADVQLHVVDGRRAAAEAAAIGADVWIPDDSGWAGVAPEGVLAGKPEGAGDVVAVSPFYMVADRDTAAKLTTAGGGWLDLAYLATSRSGVRLAVSDPAGSGDGMVAAGTLGEAVWKKQGMDASAMALATALNVTRTVEGTGPALPRAGEVGLVSERVLLDQGLPAGQVAMPGKDATGLLRYSWWPTASGEARSDRAAALRTLREALRGPQGRAAIERAGLRPPDQLAASRANELPATSAPPMDVLGPHHVEHVFTSWYPADRRTDLLVVVDVSGSMAAVAPGSRTPLISLVQKGIAGLGGLLPDDSRVALWEFGSRLDGNRDHRQLLPLGTMAQQRDRLADATAALKAQRTGTGLYDTILDAYRSAAATYRKGVPNHVIVFTDGRNEDDPGSISAGRLSHELTAAKDDDRPVALTVIAFGDRPEVQTVDKALEPVDGYVESVKDAALVGPVFVHVAAGGPHH